MKNILTFLAVLMAALCAAQSSNVTATKIRAEESFRVGNTSSQQVTGFNTSMPGSPTDTKLPTSKCVFDFVTGAVILSGATANGDLSGTYPNPVVDGIQGRPVASTAPTMGQALEWSGSQWVPGADDAGPTYSAGAGIGISVGNQISNTGDLSNTNEIQALSFSDPTLSLSNGGGSVNLSGLSDGNGIFSGSGIIAEEAEATIFTDSYFKIEWPGGNTALKFDKGENSIEFASPDGATTFFANNIDIGFNTPSFSIGSNSGSGLIYIDNASGGGIKYNADYSADFTDRNLIDKGYSDTHSGAALGTGFANGGGIGTIPDANASIGTSAKLIFNDTDWADGSLTYKPFNDGNQIVFSGEELALVIKSGDDDRKGVFRPDGFELQDPAGLTTVNASWSSLSINDASLIVDLNTGNQFLITDDRPAPVGAQYGADYSAGFVARSLVDKGFVNSIAQKSSTTTATTDGSGLLVITHSLAATPVVVVPTYVGNNPYTITVTAKGATTFTVKVWDSSGTAVASTSVTIDWFAR